MPTQDPNLSPPTQNQGPFSEYLNPARVEQEAGTLSQRPSGFMGTTGKLTMFGSQVLKGLALGKLRSYAQKEQQQQEQYESTARKVQQVVNDPDAPPELKAQLQNLTGQSWGTLVKEDLADLKKHHGKDDSHGAKVRELLGHVADKMSGPTPARHTMGGSKSTEQPFNQLNALLADYHSNKTDPKYSMTARYAQNKSAFSKKLDENGGDYGKTLNDPEAFTFIQGMQAASPQQFREDRQTFLDRSKKPTREEINVERLAKIYKGDAQPEPARTAAAPATGSPRLAPTATPDAPARLVPSPGEEVGPMLAKPSSETLTPARGGMAEVSFPLSLPGGGTAKSVSDLELWSKDNGGVSRSPLYFKKVDDKGKIIDRMESRKQYPIPGLLETTTGDLVNVNGSGWKPATAKEMGETAPAKPSRSAVGHEIRGGIRYEFPVDPVTHQKIPGGAEYVVGKEKTGKGPDPLTEELKELTKKERENTIKAEEEKNDETKRKHNAEAVVSKIIKDIYQQAADNPGNPAAEPRKLLEQRLGDFPTWYANDPRLSGNEDAVREALTKRVGEVQMMTSKIAKAAKDTQDAQRKKALPTSQGSAAPVRQAPAPQVTPVRTQQANGATGQQSDGGVPEGTIIKDPKTGKRQIAKGGQWVPLP